MISDVISHLDFGMVAVLVGIAVAGTTLAYFLARLINSERMEAEVKKEAVSIVGTLILMGALLPSLVFFDTLYASFLQTHRLYPVLCASLPEGCHINISKVTVDALLHAISHNYEVLMTLRTELSVLENIYIMIGAGGAKGGYISSPIMGGIDIIVGDLDIGINLYLWLLITAEIIKVAFYIIPILFPTLVFTGLLMRILPWYRRLGGLLVGLGLALYYVFPIPFIINGHILASTCGPSNMGVFHTINICCMDVFVMLTNTYRAAFPDRDPVLDEIRQHGLSGLSKMDEHQKIKVLETAKSLVNFFLGWALNMGAWARALLLFPSILLGILEAASYHMIMTFFTLFVALVLTVAATREISMMLGGDIEIGGLTRLI